MGMYPRAVARSRRAPPVAPAAARRYDALGVVAVGREVTSCDAGEQTREKPEWGGGRGAFAYALIKGLGGAADATDNKNSRGNGDGKVELDELVHYVRREVGDLTENAQHVKDAGRLNVVIAQTK